MHGTQNLYALQKEVQNALRYLNDVIDKGTLEMLPGSASAVLDTIDNILKNYVSNEQSTVLTSAINQVCQSLANLIRCSDVGLVNGGDGLDKGTIRDVITSVESAVVTYVGLIVEKLSNKEIGNGSISTGSSQNGIQVANTIDGSMSPNIPLSVREFEILKSTAIPSATTLGHSVSSDSILNASQSISSDALDHPPPKPPLPDGRETFRSTGCLLNDCTSEVPPPALPPKKRLLSNAKMTWLQPPGEYDDVITPYDSSDFDDWTKQRLASDRDWPSPTRRSPASISPLSISASSLDSTPNRSTDDLLTDVQRDFHSNFELVNNTSISAYQKHHTHSNVTTSSWSNKKMLEMDNVERRMRGLSCFTHSSSSGVFSMSSLNDHQSDACITSTSTASTSSASVSYTVHEQSLSSTASVDGPPAVPPKRKTMRHRTPSQYDNVPEQGAEENWEVLDSSCSSVSPRLQRRPYSTFANVYSTPDSTVSTNVNVDYCQPPPLPPKMKHVMAYMQIFGSCMQHSYNELLYPDISSSSLHTYNYEHQELSIAHRTTTIGLISNSDDSVFPSLLNGSLDSYLTDENRLFTQPPALPPKRLRSFHHAKSGSSSFPPRSESEDTIFHKPSIDASQSMSLGTPRNDENHPTIFSLDVAPNSGSPHSDNYGHMSNSNDTISSEIKVLDVLDVKPFLVFKKEDEDGPDIRGGSVDALVVHATLESKGGKNDFMYQEAFITTYRTFIAASDLINKLLYRYNKYGHASDVSRQRIARNAFSLLVRVVDDFSLGDLTDTIIQILVGFVFQLLCNGKLMLARALRKKILEKYSIKCKSNTILSPLSSKGVSTKKAFLPDFKSEQLAEQMTLLDAELFQKIEIPEVLIFARLQKEELSINLTTFTEHFNKMSYWARSRILEQEDAKDRERYVVKFIKIMKHLRKMNNFNSYLAILSALDSAPIRRLEWQKHITEGLKEYCELIDSSSSFRAYRQALAETEPPCIPYIGLILQDLTFVHIGNSDLLPDGNVNFSKRWQQFNILDSMRKFRKCQYDFKSSERILAFFNNFDDHLCEEAMWQISEGIKPRGVRKKTD